MSNKASRVVVLVFLALAGLAMLAAGISNATGLNPQSVVPEGTPNGLPSSNFVGRVNRKIMGVRDDPGTNPDMWVVQATEQAAARLGGASLAWLALVFAVIAIAVYYSKVHKKRSGGSSDFKNPATSAAIIVALVAAVVSIVSNFSTTLPYFQSEVNLTFDNTLFKPAVSYSIASINMLLGFVASGMAFAGLVLQ
jgi:hypothetical protein